MSEMDMFLISIIASDINTILDKISSTSLIIFSACFFWIMAYDTAYAMSDREGDLSIGLKSSAITFGKYSQKLIITFHLISLCLWSFSGFVEKINPIFYASIIICLVLVFFQFSLIRDENPEKCFIAFKRNNWKRSMDIPTSSLC